MIKKVVKMSLRSASSSSKVSAARAKSANFRTISEKNNTRLISILIKENKSRRKNKKLIQINCKMLLNKRKGNTRSNAPQKSSASRIYISRQKEK